MKQFSDCLKFLLAKYRGIAGFTLVELIVVITVLAILGTIGFLSIGWYSSKARDSNRLTDVASISKTLDLGIITSGSYPQPDNYFTVMYLGGVVWYQGAVGNGVLQKLQASVFWGGIGAKPLDPLTKTDYVYSSLAYGKAYQIKADYEGDITSAALDGLYGINQVYAADGAPSIAYIRGNYGGLVVKTQTGGIIYTLATPSIITNTGTVSQSLEISTNNLSGTLLFNGKGLVNASTYNPNTVVFSGSVLPTSDTSGQLTSMVNAIKSAYSGSDITAVSAISSLLSTTGSTQVSNLGSTILTGQLGGSLAQANSWSAAVNCVGSWGTCSAECTQTYTITTVATNGGTACPAVNNAIQSCSGGSCPAAGSCNNTIIDGCTTGIAINQSAGSCGGSATWTCTSAGGTSPQCTKANAACASCTLPWGGSIADGASVTAYQNPTVAYPASCVSQSQSCSNGTLAGSYTNQSCAVTYTYAWVNGVYGSCSVSCGGGTQSRTVFCQRQDGATVADANCTDPKPTTSQLCNTQACPTYSWVFSNDYGNTYVGGSNPWSMTYYGACGACNSSSIGSYCSMSWGQYGSSDPDCPNMYCGMRHVCQYG